jgi:chromatin segregation and condensation protein Rec8/ScpA/Scc1 (kleisin family)
MSIVVTFLALLDLVKQQIIRIHQQSIGDNEDIVLEEYYPIEQEPEHTIFESLP